MVPTVDQILIAATGAPRLSFTPTSSGGLAIAVGDDQTFEVGLPYHNVASFRTLLARIGTVCRAAAQKRSLVGKGKAFLMRAGLIPDKMATERESQAIQYACAVIHDQPAAPLYKVDADLYVRQPSGVETALHVMMQNELHKLFLVIEPRKVSGAP